MDHSTQSKDFALAEPAVSTPLSLENAKLKTRPGLSWEAGNLQMHLDRLVNLIDPALRPSMNKVFDDLVFLLDHLSLAEASLTDGHQASETLSILEDFRRDAHALINFVESTALQADEITVAAFDALDSMVFAIRHDLKRIFESELLDWPPAGQDGRSTRGKLMAAVGILANCLQQSIITLARLFDNTLTGAQLFDDYVTRLIQSQILCRDLEALVELTLSADTQGTYSLLANQLKLFRAGSMQYLMYKDWEEFETLSDEVVASIDAKGDVPASLQRLGCYLSTLLGHVRTRAVLADQELNTTAPTALAQAGIS